LATSSPLALDPPVAAGRALYYYGLECQRQERPNDCRKRGSNGVTNYIYVHRFVTQGTKNGLFGRSKFRDERGSGLTNRQ